MAFIYHIKAVFSKQSFAHMGVERQTNIQTYIVHANTHTHTPTADLTFGNLYA